MTFGLMFVLNMGLGVTLIFLALFLLVLFTTSWLIDVVFIGLNIMLMLSCNTSNSEGGDIVLFFVFVVIGFYKLYVDWEEDKLHM